MCGMSLEDVGLPGLGVVSPFMHPLFLPVDFSSRLEATPDEEGLNTQSDAQEQGAGCGWRYEDQKFGAFLRLAMASINPAKGRKGRIPQITF